MVLVTSSASVYKPLKNSSLQWCGLKSNWLITQIMSTCRNDRISLLTIFINFSSLLDILSSSNSQSLCYTIQSFFRVVSLFFLVGSPREPCSFFAMIGPIFLCCTKGNAKFIQKLHASAMPKNALKGYVL